jgi:hypothetical protein
MEYCEALLCGLVRTSGRRAVGGLRGVCVLLEGIADLCGVPVGENEDDACDAAVRGLRGVWALVDMGDLCGVSVSENADECGEVAVTSLLGVCIRECVSLGVCAPNAEGGVSGVSAVTVSWIGVCMLEDDNVDSYGVPVAMRVCMYSSLCAVCGLRGSVSVCPDILGGWPEITCEPKETLRAGVCESVAALCESVAGISEADPKLADEVVLAVDFFWSILMCRIVSTMLCVCICTYICVCVCVCVCVCSFIFTYA